jgi:hypothetical protein
MNYLALSLIIAIIGCDLDPTKSDDKDKSKKEIENGISEAGFYLKDGQIELSELSEEMKKGHTLYHIALQAGDQPVVGATVKVLDTTNCNFDKVTQITPIANENDQEEIGEIMPEIPCEMKVKKEFGPNKKSNFFSLILPKGKGLEMVVEADGYAKYYLPIAKKEVEFLVLTVQLSTVDQCLDQPTTGGEYAPPGVSESSGGISLLPSLAGDQDDCILGPWPVEQPPVLIDSGYDITGEKAECQVNFGREACPELFGDPQAFGQQCTEAGFRSIRCDCGVYICSEKIKFNPDWNK